MSELSAIGVLLRDPIQGLPLDFLRATFEAQGGRIHLLNEAIPETPLDLIIAMGGDGTVLKALDLDLDCPVLAINYGTVGFLTAGDRTELHSLTQRLLAGDYLISERIMLHCVHPGGSANVVNEIVLRTHGRMINVDVTVDGAKIRTIRGDGVIVGTPTGSTGYLLSTGGPIVMPDAHCFVLDGINEYNFTSRALILPAGTEIHLHITEVPEGHAAHLLIDGEEAGALPAGAQLHLTLAERRARLIFFEEDYFFRNLSSRLSWQ